MYCIYQQDNQSNEKVIGTLDFKDEFLKYIVNNLPTKDQYKLIMNTSLETINIDHAKYSEGNYLLCNDRTILFVQKSKIISEGYIYNSVHYETNIIYTWKLYNYEEKAREKYHIQKFNPKVTKNKPSFLICGKKNSGKTNLVKDIVKKLATNDEFIQNTLIISAGEYFYRDYEMDFPAAKVIYSYDQGIVKEYSDRKKGCIVFDECFASQDLIYNIIFELKVPVIITTQYAFWTKTDIGREVDYIFILKESSKYILDEVWFAYRHIFPRQEIFEGVLSDLTKDYSSMVIDNTHIGYQIENRVYWYKAETC